MANNLTGLDSDQVIRSVYDDNKNTLRVSVLDGTNGGESFEVVINQADDSIRIGDGTDLVTTTTIGPKVGLDTNIINPISTESLGFGTLSPGYPTQVTVGASISVELLPANPLRRYAHVFNNSANKIYIQYSVSAALNQGIRLNPGNYFILSGENLWLGSINAIALVSNQLIDVLEAI